MDRRLHDPGGGGADGRFRRADGTGATGRGVRGGTEAVDGDGGLGANRYAVMIAIG